MRCNFLYINILYDYPAADEQQDNRVTYYRIGRCAAQQKESDPKIHICRPPSLGFVNYDCVYDIKSISSSFLRSS